MINDQNLRPVAATDTTIAEFRINSKRSYLRSGKSLSRPNLCGESAPSSPPLAIPRSRFRSLDGGGEDQVDLKDSGDDLPKCMLGGAPRDFTLAHPCIDFQRFEKNRWMEKCDFFEACLVL